MTQGQSEGDDPGQVVDGEDYELVTFGAGSAFTLRFKAEQRIARLEGDDAARFHADYEAIKLQFPSWKPDQALAQLWDQGGYGWLAEEDTPS